MSGNFKKEDLRIKRTLISLNNAMSLLLEKKNFQKITVNDLCEEALISRAAFYTHFKDKYDLLAVWLENIKTAKLADADLDSFVDFIIYNKCRRVANIMRDADDETLKIVHHFVSSVLNLPKISFPKSNAERVVLTNFCVGGMLGVLLWQIDNRYPAEFDTSRSYFVDLLSAVLDWDSKRDDTKNT